MFVVFCCSFHEMGTKDLPAVLYHVSNITKSYGDIIYVGHSMGTTMYFIFSSILPNVARNVKLMIALAPVAYMTHVKSPVRYFAPFSNDLEVNIKRLAFVFILLLIFIPNRFYSSGLLNTWVLISFYQTTSSCNGFLMIVICSR